MINSMMTENSYNILNDRVELIVNVVNRYKQLNGIVSLLFFNYK